MPQFQPKNRLHYPWQYRLFFAGSTAHRLSACIIYRIPNKESHYRLGMTIKCKCNSVVRNRLKRRIREAFRHHGAYLGSYDYNVVIPNSKKPVHPFQHELASCLARALPSLSLRD